VLIKRFVLVMLVVFAGLDFLWERMLVIIKGSVGCDIL
jgi:hypothetical protein